MSNLPNIFSNGSVYFPQGSIFSICAHHINEGDKTGTITIRMDRGIANMWEATKHIKPLLPEGKYEGCVTFPAARRIPGRENAAGKNFFKVVIEGEVSDLAKLVVGLGGSLEKQALHAENLGPRTGATRSAAN